MRGLPRSAEIRATHALETTPDNERLIRTHHPILRLHDPIYVSHPQYGPEVWLVKGACEDIEAGRRPLHPYPEDRLNLQQFGRALTPRSPWREEYLSKYGINPRKLLSPEKNDGLRELFPAAVGARVFVSGFLVVLFNSLHNIPCMRETVSWKLEVCEQSMMNIGSNPAPTPSHPAWKFAKNPGVSMGKDAWA